MSLTFEAKFARELYALIHKELAAHHDRIFSGMVDHDNAEGTGMRFAEANGHYAGLKLCLNFMEQVEKRLFGKERVPQERRPAYDV